MSSPAACVAKRRLRLAANTGAIDRGARRGDLEVRFAARPTNGLQVPRQRDELYFVAAGTGRCRVEDKVSPVGPGDMLFCPAHVAHGFEDISADFSVWGPFYGPQKY
jgi:mannose-6-phosphate isomerase-like protein (cupin superfamily)